MIDRFHALISLVSYCAKPRVAKMVSGRVLAMFLLAFCFVAPHSVFAVSATKSTTATKNKAKNKEAKSVSKKPVVKKAASRASSTSTSSKKSVRHASRVRKAQKTAVRKAASVKSTQQINRSSSRAKNIANAAPARAVIRNVALKNAHDPLALNSSVALVADADSQEVLYAKNPHVVLPIASITKLMTVLVSLEAHVDLDEFVTISTEDIDTYKNTHSRLVPGTRFTRRELMHLALMASENRAASALGRSYPGGLYACVQQMNRRAQQLGMTNTHFDETTGLSVANRSSANDLARLVLQARRYSLIREFSTDPQAAIETSGGVMNFRNTNRLVRAGDWDIQLQKTGFINEAGRCLVMQARVGGRNLVIVLLDALGSSARSADAERIRKFVLAKL